MEAAVTFQAPAGAVEEAEDSKPLEDGELSDDEPAASAAPAAALEEGEIDAPGENGEINNGKV